MVGYMIYGDYSEPNPPARLIEAVAAGEIDVAALWGPTAGYFASRSAVPLEVRPITETAAFAPLPFQFAIAMGVRKGDVTFRDEVDAALARRRHDTGRVLREYGVPLAGERPRAGR